MDIAAYVATALAKVELDIADALTGAMVGVAPAPARRIDGKAVGRKQLVGGCAGPCGIERRMLEQPDALWRHPRANRRGARIHLGQRRVLGLFVSGGEGALDRRKPLFKFLVGAAQGRFRVSVEMPCQVDHGKEQVTDLFCNVCLASMSESILDLGGFLADLCEHGFWIVPVEADAAGFVLQLERAG